jgi:hypothetical protein
VAPTPVPGSVATRRTSPPERGRSLRGFPQFDWQTPAADRAARSRSSTVRASWKTEAPERVRPCHRHPRRSGLRRRFPPFEGGSFPRRCVPASRARRSRRCRSRCSSRLFRGRLAQPITAASPRRSSSSPWRRPRSRSPARLATAALPRRVRERFGGRRARSAGGWRAGLVRAPARRDPDRHSGPAGLFPDRRARNSRAHTSTSSIAQTRFAQGRARPVPAAVAEPGEDVRQVPRGVVARGSWPTSRPAATPRRRRAARGGA